MNFTLNLDVLFVLIFFVIFFQWNTFLDARRLHSHSNNLNKPSTLSVLYQYNQKASFNGKNKILISDAFLKKRKIVQKISPIHSKTAHEKIITSKTYSKFEDYREAMMNRGNYFTSLDDLLSQYPADVLDGIIIPSGGLNDDKTPKSFVKARLENVLPFADKVKWIILSGGYSPRTSIKLYPDGKIIEESISNAIYMTKNGTASFSNRVIIEHQSKDSIGNAYFTSNLVENLDLKNVLIVSNRFHLPRIRLIFDWVYTIQGTLDPSQLYYLEIPDVGLDEKLVKIREEKETKSMDHFVSSTQKDVKNKNDLALFLYIHHEAYAFKKPTKKYNVTLDPSFATLLY